MGTDGRGGIGLSGAPAKISTASDRGIGLPEDLALLEKLEQRDVGDPAASFCSPMFINLRSGGISVRFNELKNRLFTRLPESSAGRKREKWGDG
jgi:hypothetical protein